MTYDEKERLLNLERGESWMREFDLKPYMGTFKELDLTDEWYCPRCKSKKRKLKLSNDHQLLYCTSHYTKCEYEFKNKQARDEDKTFWSDGFKYPLTFSDITDIENQAKKDRVDWLVTEIAKLKKRTKDQ